MAGSVAREEKNKNKNDARAGKGFATIKSRIIPATKNINIKEGLQTHTAEQKPALFGSRLPSPKSLVPPTDYC